MGLFKSKRKTYVNTSKVRMVEDDAIIPSSKMAVLDYTLSQNSASTSLSAESLPDYLLRAGSNNIVARARKSRVYAKKDSYAYGLPVSNLVSQAGVDIKKLVEDALLRVHPKGVIVFDAYFGPMNNYYFLKPMLWQKYDYNYDTNELEAESKRVGFKCYMESAVIKYSKYTTAALNDPDTIVQYGLSAEAGYTPFRAANPKAPQVPWVNNYDGDHDIAEVTVVYADASGAKKTYKIVLDYLDYEPSSKPPTDGLDDSDTNNIQPDAITPTVPKSLESVDYFQANYEYVENNVTKTSTFIYAYGSGLDPILDNAFNVTDKFGSHVPRIYARMNGMACNDESLKGTPRYKSMVGICRQLGLDWNEWVNEVHKSVGSVGDVTQIFMTYSLPANTQDPLIQDYLFEYFLGLYNHIPNKFATTFFGNLRDEMISYGAKQGQAIQISDNVYTQQISFSSIGYLDVKGSIGDIGTTQSGMGTEQVSGRWSAANLNSHTNYHWYRKQITNNTYREVRVYAMSSTEYVEGGHTTVASGDDENLHVPLDLGVDSQFSNREKENLYTKSMYLVLNTIKVVKTKWYQTGIFKAIMFVVAVVVGYFFPPAGVAAYSWAAAAYAVVYAVAINLVITVAVKLLVSIGLDVGIIAAVVAVVALVLGGYSAITKSGSIATITTQQMLQASSTAFSMSSQGYALQTQKAIKDFNSLMTELTEEQKKIQEQAKELGIGQHGDLLMFEPPIGIGIRMGESPDDYYSRSIHVINYAPAIYSITESSVDLTLALPTPQQTLSNIQEKLDELSVFGI